MAKRRVYVGHSEGESGFEWTSEEEHGSKCAATKSRGSSGGTLNGSQKSAINLSAPSRCEKDDGVTKCPQPLMTLARVSVIGASNAGVPRLEMQTVDGEAF